MPKISDTWKPGFSTVAAGKAFATGNYADGTMNLILAMGQAGYAIGKNYLPKSKVGDRLGPRRGGEESLRDAFGVEAAILERGIQIVTALTLLLGSGKEQGQTYEAAASYFELAWENFKDATVAGDSWSGTSADAYNSRNAQQIEWATVMQDLDLQVAALLNKNSDMLGNCKITLTSVRAFYTACIPVAATIRWAYGPAGKFLSLAFQTAMLLVGLAVAVPTMLAAFTYATKNGIALQAVTAGYTAAVAAATVTGSDSVEPEVGTAQKTTTGTFDQINSASVVDPVGAQASGPEPGLAPPTSAPVSVTPPGDQGEIQNVPSDRPKTSSESPVAQPVVPAAYAAIGRVPGTSSGSQSASAPRATTTGPAPEPAQDFRATVVEGVEGAGTGSEAGERAPIPTAADDAEQARERVR